MIFRGSTKKISYNSDELDPEFKNQGFERLHSQIKPKPEELMWTSIPWEIDLWEARKKASRKNRPIFIWAMNGNPLGCVCANGIENRCSVFSNKEIIQILNDYFIPVAENCSFTQKQNELKGAFFRLVAEQGHFAGRTFPTGTRQGLYISTHEGKLLASTNSNNTEFILEVIKKSLSSLSQQKELSNQVVLPENYRQDPEFCYQFPKGGLILKMYVRDLPREKGNTDSRYNIDFAWFTKGEISKIIPNHVQVGHIYSLPRFFVEKLAKFHLVDTVRGESPPWRAEDIRKAKISVGGESINNNKINLCLKGFVRNESPPSFEINPYNGIVADMKRWIDLRLHGYLTYNKNSNIFERFDMIGVGSRWGATTYNFRFDDLGPSPIGFAFEIGSDSLFDQTPPQAFFNLIMSTKEVKSEAANKDYSDAISSYFL